MAVELFVAAIAFYMWLLIEPGLLRAILFNVMLIASVSTLLFNGNPLLRYDAYYILADLIEIPNLAARSTRYWGYLIERYILGVREAEAPEASRAREGVVPLLRFCFDPLPDIRDDRDRAVHRRAVLLHWRAPRHLGGWRDGDIPRDQGGAASGGEPAFAQASHPGGRRDGGDRALSSRLSCSACRCRTIPMPRACCGCPRRRWCEPARTAS